jgi:hypothetical protein
VLGDAMAKAEGILDEPPNAQTTLSTLHALSQGMGQYHKLVESLDVEKRLKALERELAKAQATVEGGTRE